jgi:hypothetical protein
MSERYAEALDELRFLSNEIRQRGQDQSYGHFHGGDPNNFSPDPECSTEAEQAAHKEACAKWNAGDRSPLPGPHRSFAAEDGRVYGHVTLCGFGLGVNVYIDEDALDWADRIDRCVDRLVDP